MSSELEIMLIAIVVAIACSSLGVFLVLRRMSMMTDAITHTVFLGIVIAFFITEDLNSPLLLVGATLVGVLTVWLTEWVYQSRLVKEDASIGVVFPLLFSIAIILVNVYSGHAHLDTDTVLLGELAFAPFDRFMVGHTDLGPVALWVSGGVCILNLLAIGLLFKEWKLSTFDPLMASLFGFMPVLLHYILMTLASLTVVASFQSVGAILVVALMIGPAAIAYMLVKDLAHMIIVAIVVGGLCAIVGVKVAFLIDVSIAGMIATVIGIVFLLAIIGAPRVGMIAMVKRRESLKLAYGEEMMLTHIGTHQDTPEARAENGVGSIHEHLHWEPKFLKKVSKRLLAKQQIEIHEGYYRLKHKQ